VSRIREAAAAEVRRIQEAMEELKRQNQLDLEGLSTGPKCVLRRQSLLTLECEVR